MNRKVYFSFLFFAFCITANAAELTTPLTDKTSTKKPLNLTQEVDAEYGYVVGSKTKQGNAKLGDVSEQNSSLKYVASPELTKDILLRVGFEWDRFSFGVPSGFPGPNTLQSMAAIIGMDWAINDQWLARIEIAPGIYTNDFDHLASDDFNAPIIVGASYLVSADLQWFFGAQIDLRSQYPVLPGAGVRWKMSEQWTLMFLLPKPQIQYEIDKNLNLYLGANILSGTFKMGRSFGNSVGRPNLNNAPLDYDEVRIGVGATWKPLGSLEINGEVGAMVYREFNFYNTHTQLRDDPAPYVGISCHSSF